MFVKKKKKKKNAILCTWKINGCPGQMGSCLWKYAVLSPAFLPAWMVYFSAEADPTLFKMSTYDNAA